MKNKFTRLISAILILTFLVSAFSIFASANDDASGETEEMGELDVLLNRNFDEGWEFDNGMTNNSNGNNFYVDYEETSDYSYNYFFRLEAASGGAGYANIVLKQECANSGQTVIQMSLKADDAADLGTIMYAQTAYYSKTINILQILNGQLVAFYDRYATTEVTDKSPLNNCSHPDADANGVCDVAECQYCNHTDINGDGKCDTCGYCMHVDAAPVDNICDSCRVPYGVVLGDITDDWLDVAFIFDWDSEHLTCNIFWGEGYTNSYRLQTRYEEAGDKALNYFRIGLPTHSDANAGMSYCVDDLQIYQSTGIKSPIQLTQKDGYGTLVNSRKEKTVDIVAGSGVKSNAQVLAEALCMKVGVDYALVRNVREAIYDGTYGAPQVKTTEDGSKRVMVPLELLLDYIGYPYYVHTDQESFDITTGTSATYITAGRNSATVNGERVDLTVAPGYLTDPDSDKQYLAIAFDDIENLFPGWLTTYDDMGLIIIYEDVTPENTDDNGDIVNRNEDLDDMVNIMKKFIFDTVKEQKVNDSYISTGTKVYNDVSSNTDNFKHPYIMANADVFNALKETHSAASTEANADLKSYILSVLAEADAYYALYADNDENGGYAGIKDGMTPVNVYSDGMNPNEENYEVVADTADGYDPMGGRLNEISEFAAVLPYLAMAYQLTGDEDYAKLAYDFQLALAEWTHWGPGYFVNCAEATADYAIAYDWLYNIYKELYGNEGVDKIAKAIYELGVHDGYVASVGDSCEHAREMGDKSFYTTATDNTNAVGSAGMIIGALSILDYATAQQGNVYSESIYLIGNNMINLGDYGLDAYAPDGSYIESATYWSYSTNYFIKMVMALTSAAGSDYGFMNTWGLDKTCYYAAQMESSDGFIWNYNDGGTDGLTGVLATMDTQVFNFIGQYYGDSTLIALRQQHLKSGKKTATILDLLSYPTEPVTDKAELPLTYHMEGIDAYVARDSWEEGALYVGIMGGLNGCSHGNIDSGNFIYHNKGVVWFMDLGSEDYNVYQYFGSSRYNYYRVNAEGQNVVLLRNEADVKYGQYSDAAGSIINVVENEHGSYVIIDNTAVYADKADTAFRGMLITNDKKTVVIQDQLSFSLSQEVAWVAQTAQQISLDKANNKVAYLTNVDENGITTVLRATLVTNMPFKFEIKNTTSTLLADGVTFKSSDSSNKGGASEYSRAGIQRLVVDGGSTLAFHVAVVLEVVDSVGSGTPVGYSWTDMVNNTDLGTMVWTDPAAPTVSEGADSSMHSAPSIISIRNDTVTAMTYIDDETAYDTRLETVYYSLSKVAYTLEALGGLSKIIEDYKNEPDTTSAIIDSHDDYLDCCDTYNEYREYINAIVEQSMSVSSKILGLAD